MLNINVHFEGEYEKKLRKKKRESGLSWHDFILVSTDIVDIKDIIDYPDENDD